MGMFDDLVPFSDHFEEGQPFTLEAAKIGPPIQTEFGTSSPALLKIGGKWYSIFGDALVNQVGRMERGDLPARVLLQREPTKSGDRQVKILRPVTD